MNSWPLLSWLVFTPWAGALLVFMLRRRVPDSAIRKSAAKSK